MDEPAKAIQTQLRLGRGIGAVVAGVLVSAIPAMITDAALTAMNIFPSIGTVRMPDHLLAIATIYRTVYGVCGAFATARLAPTRPMLHVYILGALGTLVAFVGVIATWNAGPAFEPKWYPILLCVLGMPTAWLGGTLSERTRRKC